jgi:hypothetical protein
VGEQVAVLVRIGAGLGVQVDHLLERLPQPEDDVGRRRHRRHLDP